MRIETLTERGLPQCLALARDREWLAEDAKWRMLFEVATVLGVRDDSGAVIATVAHARPTTSLDFVGMLLVASEHEQRGIGRALMRHVLDRSWPRPVLLHATPRGRPLYDSLGFAEVGATGTYFRRPEPTSGVGRSRPATPADRDAIVDLDARIYGDARPELVERLPRFAEQVRVLERCGQLAGYVAAWRNVDGLVVGPLAARTAEAAQDLVADVLRDSTAPVRLDLDRAQPEMHEWATAQGFVWRNDTVRMAARHHGSLHRTDVVWSPFTQATG
ncbi:GNAT family N-acetyltransferase [Allosaccharopolyspora coralli]|uniref:GNAT family N-acetyltransferase n=1 Tax=Allosaccharopolyspora coralli TaxID=2665642 RepID=UPI001652163C|nr:GNAT family N-acetyltransferase [Allosaccharopolyspora coralli]